MYGRPHVAPGNFFSLKTILGDWIPLADAGARARAHTPHSKIKVLKPHA